jgi:hypothetical protein
VSSQSCLNCSIILKMNIARPDIAGAIFAVV